MTENAAARPSKAETRPNAQTAQELLVDNALPGVDERLRRLLVNGEDLGGISEVCAKVVETTGFVAANIELALRRGTTWEQREAHLIRALRLSSAGTHRLKKLILLVEWMRALTRHK